MLSTLLFVESGQAHGSMVWPPTWLAGYDFTKETALKPFNNCGGVEACMWFTNYTFVEERTMAADSPMRTYAASDPDYTAWDGGYDEFFYQNGNNPWAHPGSARVDSPCGVFGGNPNGCDGVPTAGEDCSGGGISKGPDAREVYEGTGVMFAGRNVDLTNIQTTTVEAGGVLDANFVIHANHGGGYSYRLCKVPEDGDMTKLTEECFQQNTLDFASDESWIQWGPDKKNSVSFPATRSSEGTSPEGSVWTRFPVPACDDSLGGVVTEKNNNCMVAGGKTQFTPPVPGVQGYGVFLDIEDPADGIGNMFAFTVGDSLQIPKDLAAGKYVLSWRWDCEQTPQIWSTCADLEITAPANADAKKPHHYIPHNLRPSSRKKQPSDDSDSDEYESKASAKASVNGSGSASASASAGRRQPKRAYAMA